MKDKMGMDLEWRNCDKLEGIGIGETIIRIHCMGKNYLQFKNKRIKRNLRDVMEKEKLWLKMTFKCKCKFSQGYLNT